MSRMEQLEVELARAELDVLEATREVASLLRARGVQRHEAQAMVCAYTSEQHRKRALEAFDMAWPEGEGV